MPHTGKHNNKLTLTKVSAANPPNTNDPTNCKRTIRNFEKVATRKFKVCLSADRFKVQGFQNQ
jgi:hypothetical protein